MEKNSKKKSVNLIRLYSRLIAIVIILISGVSYAQPNEVLDIDSDPSDQATSSFGSLVDLNQSFTPTQSGKMTKLTIIPRAVSIGTKTLEIYEGEGEGGNLLHTQSVSVASAGTLEITLTTPIALIGGNKYTFAFDNMDIALGSNFYAGGRYEASGFNTFDSDFLVHLDIGSNINIANRGDFTNKSPLIFDVTTYGTVVGLEASDFTVTNGTASNLFEESPGSWSLDVTPTAEGLVTVSIASGAATIDGLNNDAVSASTTYDITPPTNQDTFFNTGKLFTSNGQVVYNDHAVTSLVYIAPIGTTDLTTGSTITQGTTILVQDDPACIPQSEVTCGTDPMTGMPDPPGCVPMTEVICTSSNVPVIFAPSTPGEYKLFVTDQAGNVSEPSSASIHVTSETHATSSLIFMDDNELFPGETANVTFLFLGAVTDFTKEDVTVQGGGISDVSSSDGNVTFTTTFTPSTDTDQFGFTLSLDRTLITNGSTAGTGSTVSDAYDVRTLSPAISSIIRQVPMTSSTSDDEVTFRITFNVDVDNASVETTDFTLSGTSASDGTLSTPVMVDGKTYDFTVTGLATSNGTIGLDYTGTIHYLDVSNTVSGGDPAGEETFTLRNTILSFDSSPVLSVDQGMSYTYPIEVSSNFGEAGLNITATNLSVWLELNNTNIINTIAGGGDSFDEDIPATDASFIQTINDMEYDSEGNLYFIVGNQIKKVGLDGNISTFAGTTQGFSGDGGPASLAQLNQIIGFGIDGNDNFYVADRQNFRIRKIDNAGIITTIAGTGVNADSGDGGLAVNAEIAAISLLATDKAGNVYFAHGNRIRKIGTDGIISTYAGGGSGDPTGQQATDARLFFSQSLASDEDGNIYIGQSRNIYRVDVITTVITNYVGNGITGFSGDGGTAITASIDTPTGLALDNNGTLFIVDAGNHRIRKVATDGIISTIAGNGNNAFFGDGVDALTAELRGLSTISVDKTGQVVFPDQGTGLRVVRSIQTNRASLTGTPTQSEVGSNAISLTVSNGVESTMQNFTLTVENVNDEPKINGNSFTATQDVAFEGVITATDVDGDFIDLSTLGDLPNWLSATHQLQTFTFTSQSGNFTDVIWDGENYLMTNAPLHSIQSIDELGNNLTVVAGSGTATLGTDDGIGTASRFNNPFALDIDSNGKVYVVDNQNHALREMVKDMNGDYMVSTNSISLSSPLDVLVAPNNDIYISDAGSGTIKKISGGVASTLQDAGGSDITFTTPYGLAIDEDGVLYVADNGNHAIYKIDGTTKTLIAGTEGVFGFTEGDASVAQFDEPTGIWVNNDGTVIIVSDNANDAIRRIDIDDTDVTVSTLDDAQNTPLGILQDPNSGSFLIANFDFASVIQGFVSLEISGTPTASDVGINEFGLLASDGNGIFSPSISVFVANTNDAPEFTSDPAAAGDAIEESTFSYTLEATDIDGDALSYSATTFPTWLSIEQPEHIVSTVAGNGVDEYSGDAGQAAVAGIGTPEAIAVDGDGNIFIGQDNYIRKVSTDGTISTIAGDGTASTFGDGIPAVDAQLNGIKDLHFASNGSLYIASTGTVRRITPTGVMATVTGTDLSGSTGTGDGGNASSATFNSISGIYVDNDGNVFIADSGDEIVRKIDSNGIITTVVTGVSNPRDIVEKDGLIYVSTDAAAGFVSVDESNVITTLSTGFDALLDKLAIDNLGNIYGVSTLSSSANIRRYNIATGITEEFAGQEASSYLDGLASEAEFGLLSNVAVGLNGDILVADPENFRIRKLTPQNPILTGTPGQGDEGDYSIVLEVSDGTLTDDQSFTLTVLGLPLIIEVTSGINDAFGIGEEISFQLGFDENVTLTGSGDLPSITLETGDTDRVAIWTGGGDGAANIVFTYTVQEGDQSNDLEYTSTEIDLGAYTLKSDNDIDSRIDLPSIGGGSSLAGTSAIVVDGTRPILSNEAFFSNNSISTDRAKVGDEITFSFVTSEALLSDPVVTIAGNNAAVASTGTNAYSATYTMTEGDDEGSIALTADFTDANGNEANQFTGFEAIVEFDKTAPILPTVSISSSNSNPSVAKVGDEITISVTASESLTDFQEINLDATVNGSTATIAQTGTNQYSIAYTVTSEDSEGVVSFEIDFFDITGNSGVQVIETTDESSVTIDLTSPTVEITSSTFVYNSPFEATITFSEDVTDFTLEDLVFSIDEGATIEGALSNFTGSGSVYNVTVSPPSEGAFELAVDANVAIDIAGNLNNAAPLFIITYDITSPTATISSSLSNPTNTSFEILIEVSEGTVNGFTLDDLIVGNGTASDFAGDEDDGFTATISPITDGEVTVSIEANAFTDRPGNGNDASNTLSVFYDATNPILTLSTLSADPTNAAFELIISSNETINGLELTDFDVVNGTVSNLSGSGGNDFTATISPTADGTVSVEIGADAVIDFAGNGNTISNKLSLEYDATDPTVEITTTINDPTNSNFEISIIFNENVTGFTIEDLTINNGTASNFSGSGSIYFATVAPAIDGAVSVDINAGAASDAAGNGSEASNTLSIDYDATNPTVEISTTSASPTNTNFDISITFSESVSGFIMDDLTVTNGTASNFSGSGSSYSATITPTVDGAVTVDINAGAASDAAGNGSEASNTLSIDYDATKPTVELSTTSASPTNTSFDISITFSESVSGFIMDDLTVTNGTASTFAGSGSSYSATITPTVDGAVTVDINAGAASDAAGNGSEASNTLSIDYDATKPTVELSTTSASPTNTSFDISITFSESVSGFIMDDLTVTNGTASNFSGSGSSYSATITPTADGTVSVDIDAGVASDAANNGNTVSNTLSIDYDATNPTVELSTTSASPTNTSFDISVTFSESVSGFIMDDLTVTNGTASNFAGSGSSYSATIAPTTDGTVSVDIDAGVASDAANNGNDISNTLSVGYDATNPTVEISTTSASPTNTSFDISITFSESVSGFIMDDLTVTNGTASNFSGSGSSYSATITPTMDGVVTVDIAADAASDAANNGNTVSNTLSIDYDATNPTLTSVSIISNNASDNTLANAGDVVTLTFVSSENLLEMPLVSIAGQVVTVAAGNDNSYSASYTTSDSDVEGVITFSIDFTDEVGNMGAQVTTTTDGTSVEFGLVTSINEAFIAKLNIYPNPASDRVYVELENIESLDSITLYSFSGQVVHTERLVQKRVELNVSDLPKGIYILMLMDGSGTTVQRKISIL